MALSFPIDVPLEEFVAAEVEEVSIVSTQSSPFTGALKVQNFAGDYWRLTLSYRDLNRTLAQPVLAFISSLRSQANTFKVRYPGYVDPLGAAATIPSTPLVDGALQEGLAQIKIKAAPTNTERWLAAGDIIQLGPVNRAHFHRVLCDIDTDGSGRATIDIWPRVRAGLLDNDPVIYERPVGVFRLTTVPRQQLSTPDRHAFTLNCREDL